MRRLGLVLPAFAGLLLLDAAPQSDISVCNDFSTRISVALAFEDQGHFTAAGWWAVDPNRCAPVDFLFPGATLYYAADSDSYKNGNSTMYEHWGNEMKLFVTSEKFNFDDAERSRSGTTGEMFGATQLTDQQQAKPVTMTLHFSAGHTTINVSIKQ